LAKRKLWPSTGKIILKLSFSLPFVAVGIAYLWLALRIDRSSTAAASNTETIQGE